MTGRETSNDTVRGILLAKAARLIDRAEVLVRANVEVMPELFADAVLFARSHKLKKPLTVAIFPKISREEFLRRH